MSDFENIKNFNSKNETNTIANFIIATGAIVNCPPLTLSTETSAASSIGISIIEEAVGPEATNIVPPIYGCTNPLAVNYKPEATVDDGTCIVLIYGCTNPSARNYNQYATIDDGSCLY